MKKLYLLLISFLFVFTSCEYVDPFDVYPKKDILDGKTFYLIKDGKTYEKEYIITVDASDELNGSLRNTTYIDDIEVNNYEVPVEFLSGNYIEYPNPLTHPNRNIVDYELDGNILIFTWFPDEIWTKK
jgi:hypothetical protein